MRRFLSALWAKLSNRPLALCDSGDVDGITSAALFLRKYPNGVVVLAAPSEVNRSWWIKSLSWTFVADLPCPGKVLIRLITTGPTSPAPRLSFMTRRRLLSPHGNEGP
ncbi:hypothetical protein [Vulcanisaeta distributa]|uniref:hypothetical protein n=1 Tax=Vulcanisaeta distributa TaxID=164451 RepID=UPI000A655A0A|nr:hypothetical protein [Vulcanisaeta distributa]